ncbi:hypothetical protein M1555_01990 [Patescibacteria group bacterium]|nr:hypothetical protein [Patescibacteria group bacterium]
MNVLENVAVNSALEPLGRVEIGQLRRLGEDLDALYATALPLGADAILTVGSPRDKWPEFGSLVLAALYNNAEIVVLGNGQPLAPEVATATSIYNSYVTYFSDKTPDFLVAADRNLFDIMLLPDMHLRADEATWSDLMQKTAYRLALMASRLRHFDGIIAISEPKEKNGVTISRILEENIRLSALFLHVHHPHPPEMHQDWFIFSNPDPAVVERALDHPEILLTNAGMQVYSPYSQEFIFTPEG